MSVVLRAAALLPVVAAALNLPDPHGSSGVIVGMGEDLWTEPTTGKAVGGPTPSSSE